MDPKNPLQLKPPAQGLAVPEEDPRARAARRVAELEAHWGSNELPADIDTSDQFYFDRKIIPDGWDYQWWPYQVIGKEDPSAWVNVEGGGWEPVPRSRHPEMMPFEWPGACIEKGGQRLMERPMIITLRSRARDKMKAQTQLGDKERELYGTPSNHLPRQKSDGTPLASIKRSYETIEVPK